MRCDRSSPFDEFHHEGFDAVGFLEPVDGGDVGMIERGEDFRFALKASQPSGSAASDGGRILMATWRFSLVSVARYTCPMPPSPIWAVTS